MVELEICRDEEIKIQHQMCSDPDNAHAFGHGDFAEESVRIRHDVAAKKLDTEIEFYLTWLTCVGTCPSCPDGDRPVLGDTVQ